MEESGHVARAATEWEDRAWCGRLCVRATQVRDRILKDLQGAMHVMPIRYLDSDLETPPSFPQGGLDAVVVASDIV